jgi:hypothetical protein
MEISFLTKIKLFTLFFGVMSCSNPQQNSIKEENIKEINFIKNFYKTFYFDDNIHFDLEHDDILKIEKQFLSKRIITLRDTINRDDQLVLDYDPFIQGQDFNGESIKNTLRISPLKGGLIYKVSFILFGFKNEKRTEIDLLLEKSENSFLISAVLNDDFLSYKEKYENIIFIDKPCIDYYNKELCDEWARQEKEEKEKNKQLTQWQGTYSFGFGRTHMGGSSSGGMRFHIKGKNSYFSSYDNSFDPETGEISDSSKQDSIPIKIVRATKDTLQFQESEGSVYNIYIFENSYIISGDDIYMLSPPNNNYPLSKE